MERLLNKNISVYWESEEEWFEGVICDFNPVDGINVRYFDGDEEWLLSYSGIRVEGFEQDEIREIIAQEMTSGLTSELEIIPHKNMNYESLLLKTETISQIEMARNKSYTAELEILMKSDDNYDAYPSIQNAMAEEREELEIALSLPADNINLEDIPEKGALLRGYVFSANYLPPPSFNSGEENCFFRVLYVENQSKSSMFSCRTPIFSSEVAKNDVSNPQWDLENNSFLFELVNPLANKFEITGGIIISIYRCKPQGGGNEMVGETSFNLSEIARTGDIEYFSFPAVEFVSVQGRSQSGVFPLTTRQNNNNNNNVSSYSKGEKIPELNARLEIIWRSESVSTPRVAPATDAVKVSRKGKDISSSSSSLSSQGRRKSVGTPVQIQIGKSEPGPAVARRPTGTPSGIPVSSSLPAVGGRRIVSAGLKKKKEEQIRIERENKILMNKLGKHAAPTPASINIYEAQPKKSTRDSSDANAMKKSSKRGNHDDANCKITPSDNASNLKNLSLMDLSDVLNKIKQDAAAVGKDNQLLKAQLMKTKSTIKKLELFNNRVKKTMEPKDVGSSDVLVSPTAGNKHETLSGNDDINNSYVNNNIISKSFICAQFDLEESKIHDKELVEIIEEHVLLQNIRKGLLNRNKNAHDSVKEIKSIYDVENSKNCFAFRRLLNVYPHALISSYFESFLKEIQESPIHADVKQPKRIINNIYESKNSSNREINELKEEGDSEINSALEKLHRLDSDIANLQSTRDESFHLGEELDAIAELEAIFEFLNKTKDNLEVEVKEKWKNEKDFWKDRFDGLIKNKIAYRLRDAVHQLRICRSNLIRREKQMRLDEVLNNIELNILDHKMKQAEREIITIS